MRVPEPHSALFLVWQSLRRQDRRCCSGTAPIGWDTGFCSRISLISAGTQNRPWIFSVATAAPRLVPGETCTEAGGSTARKF